jgi:hypothetical protein
LTVALGSVPVKVSGGSGCTVMVTGPVVDTVGLLESVHLTERVEEPAVVGVPVMVWLLMVRPAGTAPERTVQVYGPVPPVTPMVPV